MPYYPPLRGLMVFFRIYFNLETVMKKVLAILSSFLIMGAVTSHAFAADPAQPSIAVVNVQQLFQQSPKIANLNKQLQSKFNGRRDKLMSQQKNLQAELEKYKKESSTMSQKDKDALKKRVTDDQANLAKDAAAFQQDLGKEQNAIMKNVLAQLNGIISNIAKKNNYSLVLDSQAVIYSNENADITKQVSKEFDDAK